MPHLGPIPARPTANRTARTVPMGRLVRLLVAVLLGTLALAACQLGPSSPNADPSASGEPTATDSPQAQDPGTAPTESPQPSDDPQAGTTPTESATPTPEPSDTPSTDPGTGGGGNPSPGPVSGTTLFGAAPPMTEYNYNMAAATQAMESKVGRLQARREYRQWNENWGYYVPDDVQNGRVPVISVKAPSKAPGGWQQVASGSEDARIRDQASKLASYNTPIYLTFNHEPENDAPDNSAAFRAASEHFYDVVKSVAPSVQVGPTLMAWTARGGSGRNVADWLYSDDKMDFIAWDGYNFNGPNGGGWQSPAQIFDRPMAVTQAHGKPALISETGVHGAYNGPNGQTPSQWLQAMVDYAEQNGVVLVAYFNTGAQQERNSVIMTQPMEQVYQGAISRSNARR